MSNKIILDTVYLLVLDHLLGSPVWVLTLQTILSRNLFLVAILARKGGSNISPIFGPPESIPKRPKKQQQQQQQQQQQEQEQEQSQVTESKRHRTKTMKTQYGFGGPRPGMFWLFKEYSAAICF